jgi:hypothetical protein
MQHVIRPRRWTACWAMAGLIVLLAQAAAQADSPAFQRFFGEYVGEAISETGGELGKRDISAKIAAHGKGFGVKWVVVIPKAKGEAKRIEYSINFQPASRENIYKSAMRTDAFGNAVPLDPMRGDPYFWARIEGSTLTIYALIITENGGYEMQVYERILTPGGMDLKYSRVRDGTVLRTVTGTLKKIR